MLGRTPWYFGSCVAVAVAAVCGAPYHRAVAEEAGVKLWIEAEDYLAQTGSTARFYPMPGASGGKIVDSGWGGRAGHLLRYRVELPRDLAKLYVTLKCAR
ncbi:MAG: hypothetical protein ACYTFI_06065, partial [Planctomycetota bacterium]